MDHSDNKNGDTFVNQLMVHRRRIYAFILTLVANTSDADDIMQETATVMWKKYQEAGEINDFAVWGMRIAHFKVLEFRKKKYQNKVQFNSELFDSVLGGAMSINETVDNRFEVLQKCLSKLDARTRDFLHMRHQKGKTIKDIAEVANISQHAAYKRMARLHDSLVRCVKKTLKEEGSL